MEFRNALVTGAGKRLGRAMALDLGKQGFGVAVHYNTSATEAEAVVDEIKGAGGRAVALGADLLVEDAVRGLVGRARDALGGDLSVLVNNASIFEHDDLSNGTRQSWDRAMESNLRAPVALTQDFAVQAPDPIVDQDRGEPVSQALVVNMLDQRVRKMTPFFMSYTVAKMGLWAFTRTAAQMLAPKVRVNAIGPGPTLQGARQSSEHFQAQRDATILRRGADVEDIVAALRYLQSAKAVTGQIICVDGGQHLAWDTPDVTGLE